MLTKTTNIGFLLQLLKNPQKLKQFIRYKPFLTLYNNIYCKLTIVYFNNNISTHNRTKIVKQIMPTRKLTTFYYLYKNFLLYYFLLCNRPQFRSKVFRTLALCLPVFPYEMLLLTSELYDSVSGTIALSYLAAKK